VAGRACVGGRLCLVLAGIGWGESEASRPKFVVGADRHGQGGLVLGRLGKLLRGRGAGAGGGLSIVYGHKPVSEVRRVGVGKVGGGYGV